MTLTRRKFLKWLGVGSLGIFGGGATFAAWKPSNFYYKGPKSDHFNGVNFFNPEGVAPRKLSEVLKWQLSGGKAKWPAEYPSKYDKAKPEPCVDGDEIKITMIGHATLLVQVAGLNFITDPVFVERASPFQFAGPKRVNPPGVRFEDLPPIDYVLLSHNHYDHLDLETLSKLIVEHDATIITPLGNDVIVRDAHFSIREKIGDWTVDHEPQFITGDWGDVFKLKNDTRVHFEPAHHWSARGIKDRRMALWAAFVLETPQGKIYHIGDTGFHSGINYKALFQKHGEMRASILPIGAYEPRWFMKGQHQNPDEAVQGHLLCKSKITIAHHWGTFQLTNEAIEAPLEALVEAKKKYGLIDEAFVILRPGQTTDV